MRKSYQGRLKQCINVTVSNMEANDKPSPAIQCLENFLNYLEAKGKSYSDIVIGKTDKNGDRNLRLDYITDGFTYFSDL